MKSYSKDDLREDFDLLIQAWLKSENENTTYLADSLATYAVEKLNGEIRESSLIDFATELQKIGFNEYDDIHKVVAIYLKSIKERT